MNAAHKRHLKKAANMDLKIPEWKDGKIIFVDPREKLKKRAISGFKVNYPIGKKLIYQSRKAWLQISND